jgi:anti-sigma factor RsiW
VTAWTFAGRSSNPSRLAASKEKVLEFATNHPDCERARALASLALDARLSDVDSARLAAHLRACPECKRRVEETAALTQALRAAPLEEPGRRVVVPTRRASPQRARRLLARGVLAATLAVVAAGIGVVAGSVAREPARETPSGPDLALLDERREVRELRRVKSPPPVEREAPRGGRI